MHSTDSATLVWLLTAAGGSSFHASRLSRGDLAGRVGELRRMLDFSDVPVGREPALQPARLYALNGELLAPFGDKLAGVRSLIVATQGPLASLPLAALVTEAPQGAGEPAWLVRRMAVSQVPSASALQSLRRVQPVPAAKAMIGFADPLFELPGEQAEVGAAGRAANRQAGAARDQRRSPAGRVGGGVAARYEAERGFRYGQPKSLG